MSSVITTYATINSAGARQGAAQFNSALAQMRAGVATTGRSLAAFAASIVATRGAVLAAAAAVGAAGLSKQLVGTADSMAQLAGWRDPALVMQLATLVVFPRGGDTVRADVPGDASVVVFETRVPDVSSSEIRARLERGEPVTGEIAPAVADYIVRHRLYAQG